VTYPTRFTGATRTIRVDGEIYANVAHDAARPFIVQTDSMQVRVYGTEFNFSAYRKEEGRQVVLVKGSVAVTYNNNTVRLTPRQAYTCHGAESSLKTVDTELYTSWTDGVYRFEDVPFEQVLRKLARYYNVTMSIPKQPSGVVCYGSLELKNDLNAQLTGLMQLVSFNFVIKDNQYIIQFN
jgi:ferric-dicitrate binding protein FerR (iron transport regulator)